MGDYFAEESHIWSSGRTHYKNSYYSDKFNQLKHIVEFVNSFKKRKYVFKEKIRRKLIILIFFILRGVANETEEFFN